MMTVSAPPVVPASLKLTQASQRLELGAKLELNNKLHNVYKILKDNALITNDHCLRRITHDTRVSARPR
jgi:hypothetical protein